MPIGIQSWRVKPAMTMFFTLFADLNKRIEISFIEDLRRSAPQHPVIGWLLNILTLPLYPLILIAGLLIMIPAGIMAIWQKLTATSEETDKAREEQLQFAEKQKEWTVLFQNPSLTIQRQLAGSLPMGSGDYLHLSSTPAIEYLDNNIFGDWFLVAFDGIFLQKWNHPRNINCDLVFIPFDTLEPKVLVDNIPTKEWTTERLNDAEVKFTFEANEVDNIYIVRQTDLYGNI